MFRQVIKLAIEALKVELAAWREPPPAGAEPVQAVEQKSCTSPFLESVRASVFCPFCAGPKVSGDMQCPKCASVHNRKPKRTTRKPS